MDRLKDLPDELLLVILSFLPAKDVTATMVLSKRWNFLWKFVPKLDFDHTMYQDGEDTKFMQFTNSLIPLNSAPVLERLRFKLSQKFLIGVYVGATALKRCIRELIIETDQPFSTTQTKVFFRGLCTSKVSMLVILRLSNIILANNSSPISFPSLKKLSLMFVKYPGSDEFVKRFISSCPVLGDLVVKRFHNDDVMIFTISVPSLESLTLSTHGIAKEDALGFAIDAPSLKFLSMADYVSGFCNIEKKMPKIVEVSIDVDYSCTKQLLGSIASVQQLCLCLSTSMEAYDEGRRYSQLVRLDLCICQTKWLNLLMRLLNNSPQLKFLKLDEFHQIRTGHIWPCWSEPPSSVPKCVSSSLETFEWMRYEGREEEKQVAKFILGNSRRLKNANFYHKSTDPKEKDQMLKELSMLPRSSTCQLAFKQSYGQAQTSR